VLIASNFDTARPTVSKHLQILTKCGLLEQEQNGREISYHINGKEMKEVADFTGNYNEKIQTKKIEERGTKNKNQYRRRQAGIAYNKGI
jgi:DNA-binding transcriptional ArsR family regulator